MGLLQQSNLLDRYYQTHRQTPTKVLQERQRTIIPKSGIDTIRYLLSDRWAEDAAISDILRERN
ncbi:MAG: hypothetical protein KKB31_03805 [Nanoarchaeota archaeon]|nr:hypothetical protein [Nanoarchaeota archaeon]